MSIFSKIFLIMGFAMFCFVAQAQSTYTSIVYSDSKYGFNYPRGITADSIGNVWVANDGSGITKIPVSNPNNPIVFNDPKYQFANPQAIAVDSKGNVWVACLNYPNINGSVVKIPKGDPARMPGIFNTPNYSISGPQGMTVDSNDNVWVANSWGNTVTEILASNNKPVVFSDAKYQFSFPLGIARDSNGNVWVSNNNMNRVTEIPGGSLTTTPVIYSRNPTLCDLFCVPGRLTVDANNNVWVPGFNTVQGQVTVIPAAPSTANPAIYSGAAYGSSFAALDRTVDATHPQGSIWTTNWLANSVSQISISDPTQVVVFSGPAYGFNYPLGLAVDVSGNVWVTNYLGQSVTKLQKN